MSDFLLLAMLLGGGSKSGTLIDVFRDLPVGLNKMGEQSDHFYHERSRYADNAVQIAHDVVSRVDGDLHLLVVERDRYVYLRGPMFSASAWMRSERSQDIHRRLTSLLRATS